MNILPKSEYEKVFDGSQITIQHIKLLLEESGITSIIRDDGESALRGGFGAAHGNNVKLFVNKKDVLKAKHIINSKIDNINIENIPDADFEALARQKDPVITMTSSKAKKNESYRRSPFNLILNIIIIIYSAWRLSPLLNGESLPTWRIVLSGSLIVFCGWALMNHFGKKA